MRAEAQLDSVVFQLTPTRTRCDLVIIGDGKTEKVASGLLTPFLAHLRAAKDQISKGGYSIKLEPDPSAGSPWFTKGTIERFVRFVSTPEVLERVSTIESEILQIEGAITVQYNENLGLSTVEEHHIRSSESTEGSKSVLDAGTEKAIVMYKAESQQNPPDSNGSTTQEENSKVHLLRILETRKIVLQKEQGMAFARATAAGFDMDHMTHLILFAESFGASRLKEACVQFMELWKVKHETGQWLEVEAVELMSTRSGFSPFNASGIVLSGDARKQNDFTDSWLPPSADSCTESNGNDLHHSGDKKLSSNHQLPPGSHEYFQGQFQQSKYPSLPMHPPPVYPPYPMQGMPYYQNYPGDGPFYPPPYPPPEFSNSHNMEMRRHSMNSKDSNADSQDDSPDQNLSDYEKDGSRGHKSHKKSGRSGKKKSGMVVIRNLNYIASKRHESSGGESPSASESERGEETEGSQSDTVGRKNKKSSRSSKKKKDGLTKSLEKSNTYEKDVVASGQDANSGDWQAFQSFLLKAEENITSTVDRDMFAGEKGVPNKRRQNVSEVEPILTPKRDSGNTQETRIMEFDSVNGKTNRSRWAATNDEFLTSSDEIRDSRLDAQFKEIEGGHGRYKGLTHDDFMIHGRENQMMNNVSLDPLGDHEYDHPVNLEKGSYIAIDESFIVPVRSGSQYQVETDSRTAIDMDIEFPSSHRRKEDSSYKAELSYEPDDLTLMPERPIESEYIGYDPAIDYDMEIPIKISVKEEESLDQEDTSASIKEDLNETEKEKKLKVLQDGPERRKKDVMMRRGIHSKMSPVTEAQKRAEKLRAYKVDLQKAKKENEEEQRKRLEALKLERLKRIAARSGSNSAQSPSATKQTRAKIPTKVSPSSFKGSKFSDTEPSSHSPIPKLPISGPSSGSNDCQKIAKSNRSNSNLDESSLSVSSLNELKKETNGVIPEPRISSARLKRLSDPKVSNTQHTSHKLGATDQVRKRNINSEPQMKKISAIMQLDKTKSATLPELKIKTPVVPSDRAHNKSTKETLQKGHGSKTSTSSSVVAKNIDEKIPRISYCDDNPVIEKTVMMLENEIVIAPAAQVSEGIAGINDDFNRDDKKGMTGIYSEYAAVRALPSAVVMDEIEDPSHSKLDDGLGSYEVVNDLRKGDFQNFSNTVTENSYQAPYARASSMEYPAANNLDYSGADALNSEMSSVHFEPIRARVSNFADSSSINQTYELSGKPRSKESRGFGKLLKFGRKSHSPSSADVNIDSDGLVADDHAEAPSNGVHILKNLISQDDGQAGGAPPRVHRPFSILSPFRSNKTSEKKLGG